MKKLLALMLVGAMTLSMVGCGSKNTETKAADTTTDTKTEATDTTADATTDTTADATTDKSDVTYIISTDTAFAPFEFTDANNEFVGIDVDILAAIAEDQGFKYELNSLGFDAALLAVEAGQADGVIAGMSITEERKGKFDFSEAYFDADVTMAVAKDSGITKYEDLKGKNVAIKTGTNGGDFAKSIADKYGFTVTEFADSPTMYQDVIGGNSAACFEDYPVMAYNIQQGAGLVIPEGILEAGSSYGFAVGKGQDAELLAMFNEGLKNIKANGKYQEIVDKYTK